MPTKRLATKAVIKYKIYIANNNQMKIINTKYKLPRNNP